MFGRCCCVPHYAVFAVTLFDSRSLQDNSAKTLICCSGLPPNVIAYSNHYTSLTIRSSLTYSSVVLPLSQTNHLTATHVAPFAFTWRIFITVPGSPSSARDITTSPTRGIISPWWSFLLIIGLAPTVKMLSSWWSYSSTRRAQPIRVRGFLRFGYLSRPPRVLQVRSVRYRGYVATQFAPSRQS